NNFLAAVLILLLVTWYQQPERSGVLVASSFVAGLALTNQQTVILLAPAFCWILWQHRRKLRLQLIASCLLAFAIGLLPYAYIPWASARHPAYNWGNVSSLHDFILLITRRSFGSGRLVGTEKYLGGSLLARIIALGRSFGLFAGILLLLGAVQ